MDDHDYIGDLFGGRTAEEAAEVAYNAERARARKALAKAKEDLEWAKSCVEWAETRFYGPDHLEALAAGFGAAPTKLEVFVAEAHASLAEAEAAFAAASAVAAEVERRPAAAMKSRWRDFDPVW